MKSGSAKILAKKLKRLRGERTQKEFARHLGIAPSQLNRLEQGILNTTLTTIDQLCARLRCSASDLFKDEPAD